MGSHWHRGLGGRVVSVPVDALKRHGVVTVSRRRAAGAVAAAAVAAGAVVTWPPRDDDRFAPGSTVQGINLGGLSWSEAEEQLRARLATFSDAAITYRWHDRVWAASAADLGVDVDFDATLATAWRDGRSTNLFDRYAMLGAARHAGAVPVVLMVDHARLDAFLRDLAPEIASDPQDARLVADGATITVQPARTGVMLDLESARRDSLAVIQRVTPADVTLRTLPVPPDIDAADLTASRMVAETLLSGPVTIALSDRRWSVSVDQLAAALMLPDDPVGDRPVLDTTTLTAFLDPIAAEVNHPPQNATVAWDDGLYAMKAGYAGAEVDLAELARRVSSAATADRIAELPVIYTPAAIDANNLAALGITTPLATGSSSFAGSSEARATNVHVAADRVSQALVPPGGVFSFNDVLGPIAPESGYVEGKVIAGNWYASDLGGGVCQVSTTVFRAALFAGFPFTEWHPHTFRLGFYELDGWPPGMDAAIYQPNTADEWELDLQFVNPTAAWLLLQTRFEGETLVAGLYGTPTGWEVAVSEPAIGTPVPPPKPIERPTPELTPGTRELAQEARPGVEVVVTRRVRRGEEIVSQDTFVSPYEPQPEVWLVASETG
jgi:vancomycin resistance protein YoaR